MIALFSLVAGLAASAQDTISARVLRLTELPVAKDSSRMRVQLLNNPTSQLDTLEAHLSMLAPGQAAHPPHVHSNTEELIIVKEGNITVTIAGKSKQLSTGGVALSLPGDLHGAVNTGKTKASYYVIKYTRKAVDAGRGAAAGGSILMDWPEVKVDKTDRGERRQFFNRATALFSKFDMHVTTLNKGAVSHAPHVHQQEEIILIKEGNVSMQIGDKFYPAGPGDFIFLHSGVPHALQNTGNGTTTYFAFQWQ